jgi:hypothetical protein
MNDGRLRSLYQRALASGAASRPTAHVDPERLRAVADRRADEDERATVLEHVRMCPTCRNGYNLLRSLDEAGRQRRWALPAALAASLILVLGVGTWRVMSRGPDDLERGTSEGVTLIAPVGGSMDSVDRRFVWRAVGGALDYELQLVDEGGSLVFRIVTADSTTQLPDSVPLSPGTEYRWMVAAQLRNGRRLESRVEVLRWPR